MISLGKRDNGLHKWLVGLPPPFILIVLYASFILLGSLLLCQGFATKVDVSYADALFTSVSAVTVTGLGVVDTGASFSVWGQAIIVVLMELGGIGLMVFATLVLSALGIRVGLPHRHILREDLNQTSIGSLSKLVRTILAAAMILQAIGAALLLVVFVPEHGAIRGLWYAVFHAVSAFNNAGFSLYPDSLSRYVSDPVVNIVIPALFIIGGIGFIVLDDIRTRRNWRGLTLHSKLTLLGTAVLLVFPPIVFLMLEWSNDATIGQLPLAGKLWASWFQAATTRTAGFNTVTTAALEEPTKLMTMALMVIGGGSTSTAGGLKVTTVFVLVLATSAFFRRSSSLHAFSRSMGATEVLKVMALTTISTLAIVIGIFLASVAHREDFDALAFEVVSAFGTVGLSLGVTAELDWVGRGVIMVMMFLGRVGPLTLGFFLATRTAPLVRYPRGRVHLG